MKTQSINSGREIDTLTADDLETCSDCGVLLRDCGPRCAVCDDTSTDDLAAAESTD